MTLFGLIFLLIAIGVVMALIRLVPDTILDPTMKQIILGLIILAVVLLLVRAFFPGADLRITP